MNTLNENVARLHTIQSELAQAKSELADTMVKMRSLTEEAVKGVLTMYGQGAPINSSMTNDEARNVVMDYMIDAKDIPVLPLTCRNMVAVGFDESLITYKEDAELGTLGAGDFGFIDGIPLLKFVGFLNFDAPTLEQAALLMSIQDDDTKH